MKKITNLMLIILNLCASACLLYFGYLFVSGSDVVAYPDAMIPMKDWERGGMALTMGLFPLFIANLLGYLYIQLGSKKMRRILFIPSLVCLGLVVCYWSIG
ncbi:MAG: hypothetical protein IKW81_06225 [Pseudobutyrivibrio sp.]|nr:hypothetical protein [Pseudobutyrivibrio sp.]